MNEKLMKDIIKTKNAIRKKLKALKRGRVEAETQLEETFKPITKPLKELVAAAKLEPKEEKPKDVDEFETPPKRKYLKLKPPSSTPFKYDDDDDDDDAGDETLQSEDEFATPTRSSTIRGPQSSLMLDSPEKALVNKYVQLAANNSSDIDTAYGVYKKDNEWKIGNSTIEIGDMNITIKGRSYIPTEGLCELLFMRLPKGYNKEDLKNYQTILKDTSAYRRNFDESEQIKGTNTHKYKNIIKKLVDPKQQQQHKGAGLMRIPKEDIDYIYWDDPNELVDRLRLLIASKMAGNNSHSNEIVSIIEELREAGIIV